MSLLLLVAAALAAPLTIELAPVANAPSGPFPEWTALATVPQDAAFAARAAVDCKTGSGCRLRNGAGQSVAVKVTRDGSTLRFAAKSGVSYSAFGTAEGWTMVWKLGNKEWNDDWLTPV